MRRAMILMLGALALHPSVNGARRASPLRGWNRPLDVSLDGKHGWWILDSGYEYSLLDSATAQASGITVSTPTAVAQPGGSVTQGWARGVALDVSGPAFHPDSLAVLLAHRARTRRRRADRRPSRPRLLRAESSSPSTTPRARWMLASARHWRCSRRRDRASASGSRTASPSCLATLWVAGRTVPAKLKLDTGSLERTRPQWLIRGAERLFPADWPRRLVEGIAVGGATRNFVGRLDSMAFGGVVIPQPVAGWSEDLARVGDAGTLGAPNLARFRVTFDYARQRLRPAAPTQTRPRARRGKAAGMFLVQVPGGDVLVARSCRPPPPTPPVLLAGDLFRRWAGWTPSYDRPRFAAPVLPPSRPRSTPSS